MPIQNHPICPSDSIDRKEPGLRPKTTRIAASNGYAGWNGGWECTGILLRHRIVGVLDGLSTALTENGISLQCADFYVQTVLIGIPRIVSSLNSCNLALSGCLKIFSTFKETSRHSFFRVRFTHHTE